MGAPMGVLLMFFWKPVIACRGRVAIVIKTGIGVRVRTQLGRMQVACAPPAVDGARRGSGQGGGPAARLGGGVLEGHRVAVLCPQVGDVGVDLRQWRQGRP